MDLDARIRTVRRFNRFYTRQVGLLHEGLAGTAFPLTEARVLYELAHRERVSLHELASDDASLEQVFFSLTEEMEAA